MRPVTSAAVALALVAASMLQLDTVDASPSLKSLLKRNKGTKEISRDVEPASKDMGPIPTGSDIKCDADEYKMLQAKHARLDFDGQLGAALDHASVCLPRYIEIFKAKQTAEATKKQDEVTIFHKTFLQTIDYWRNTYRMKYEIVPDAELYEMMQRHWTNEMREKLMDIPVFSHSLAMSKAVLAIKSKFGHLKLRKPTPEIELETYLLEPCKKFIDSNQVFEFYQFEAKLLEEIAREEDSFAIGSENVDQKNFFIEMSKYQMCKRILQDKDTIRKNYEGYRDIAAELPKSATYVSGQGSKGHSFF